MWYTERLPLAIASISSVMLSQEALRFAASEQGLLAKPKSRLLVQAADIQKSERITYAFRLRRSKPTTPSPSMLSVAGSGTTARSSR